MIILCCLLPLLFQHSRAMDAEAVGWTPPPQRGKREPRKETSGGIIPFRLLAVEGATPDYLMVQMKGGEWCFPKGRTEPGDGGDIMTTSLREFEEETGIPRSALRVFEDWGPITKSYKFNQSKPVRKKIPPPFLILVSP